jgi:hypothetical protein
MSWETQSWAAKQRPGSSSAKLVLLGLASCADANHCAYPSIQWLCDFSDLNRKTVIASLQRLEAEAALIEDTGERRGRTNQVKVYRLRALETQGSGNLGSDPATLKSAGNGTVPKSGQSLKRNSSAFSRKESQNRDTEPFREPIPPSSSNEDETPTDEIEEISAGAGKREEQGEPEKAKPAKPAAADRGHRLPADWQPPAIGDLQPMARELVREWPKGAYEAASERFRLHYHTEAGTRACKKDWASTHAKWLIGDHDKAMRAGKAGTSFAKVARSTVANGDVPAVQPVAERLVEGGTADGLRKTLAQIVGKATYARVFEETALLIDDDTLRVVAPTSFAAGYIENNYSAPLLQAVQRTGIAVEFIRAEVTKSPRKAAPPAPKKDRP